MVTPDAGEIRLGGEAVLPRTPREAWRLGVGMVHQHFALVPRLTVLENLALGRRGGWAGLRLPLDEVARQATALSVETGLEVPLDRRVEGLGVGDRQRAEILKVLLREPRVLVLDEPTAVLSPPEVDALLDLLGRLAGQGKAVLLVAHKLDEVLAVADRVTVLRGGRTVLEAPRAAVDAGRLADAMVGSGGAERAEIMGVEGGAATALEGDAVGASFTARTSPASPETPASPEIPATAVANLANVRVVSEGRDALRGVDLVVRRGEIVGIAGVEGNGQRELASVLAGRRLPDSGQARIPADPAFIPQDRGREGLVASFTLAENLALALQRDPAYRRGPWLRWKSIRARTVRALADFEVRAPGPDARAGALSGGNQQKLVVARELAGDPTLLVAENPTRGLDVAAAAFVHARLRELRARGENGPGIVLVSADLDEILALADRVLVMVRGRLTPVPEAERTRAGIGRRMLAGGDQAP